MNEKIIKQIEKNLILTKYLFRIQNNILSNASYHTKEMETQIMKAEKNGNMTPEEKQIITDIWDKRNKIAVENMRLYKELFNENEV
jgi:hypothetical protein